MSEHHISSIKMLASTAIALFILTGLTVGVSYVPLGHPFNLVAAIAIAVLKAGLVSAFFMELYWDKRFNAMLFVMSVVFLLLLVGLSMLDTFFRIPVTTTF